MNSETKTSQELTLNSTLESNLFDFEIEEEQEESSLESQDSETTQKKEEKDVPLLLKRNISVFIFWFILFIKSNEYWKQSLKPCHYGMGACFGWFIKNSPSLIIPAVKFATIRFFIVLHSFLLFKNDYRALKCVCFFFSVFSFVDLFIKSKGFDFEDHSRVNILFVTFILFIYLLIFLFIYISWRIIKNKKRKKLKVCWVIFWGSLISYFLIFKVARSCSNLDYTIGGLEISEKDGTCQFKKSSICWHTTFDGFDEPLTWSGNNCKKRKMDNEHHKKM